MPPKRLPERLLSLLEAHGASYDPLYSSGTLSDHGPMACLAMHGLGIDEHRIGRFAATFHERFGCLSGRVAEPSLRHDSLFASWLGPLADAGQRA